MSNLNSLCHNVTWHLQTAVTGTWTRTWSCYLSSQVPLVKGLNPQRSTSSIPSLPSLLCFWSWVLITIKHSIFFTYLLIYYLFPSLEHSSIKSSDFLFFFFYFVVFPVPKTNIVNNVCWVNEWMNEWNVASVTSVFLKHCRHPHETAFHQIHFSPWEGSWLQSSSTGIWWRGVQGAVQQLSATLLRNFSFPLCPSTAKVLVPSRSSQEGRQAFQPTLALGVRGQEKNPPMFQKSSQTAASGMLLPQPPEHSVSTSLLGFAPAQETDITTQWACKRDYNCRNKIATFLGNCHWPSQGRCPNSLTCSTKIIRPHL